MRTFNPVKRSFFALIDCVLPDEPRHNATIDEVKTALSRFLREISPLLLSGYKLLLLFLEILPILTLRSIKPFSLLSRHDRRRVFAGLLESRILIIRNISRLLLSPLLLVYFSREDVMEYIGYRGNEWIEKMLKEHRSNEGKNLQRA